MPTILIVEDNPHLREFFRAALEGEGYQVVVARDGRAGVEAYRREPADLVVCDLFMPEMDGLAVIRALRLLDREVKVVAVSGGGRDIPGDFLGVARLLGAVEALAKPFGPDELIDAVHRCLPNGRDTATIG